MFYRSLRMSKVTAVDLGGWETVKYVEAPRRPGAVYGEEYHLPDAWAFVARVQTGQ